MKEARSSRKMFSRFITALALCCVVLSLWLVFEQYRPLPSVIPALLNHEKVETLSSISNTTSKEDSAKVISQEDSSSGTSQEDSSSVTSQKDSASVISHVRNETLGVCAIWPFHISSWFYDGWTYCIQFEKVFVINLKERGDKLDAITLAASLTGIKLDVMEGARGEDVSNKSIPAHDGPDVFISTNGRD